MKIGSICNVVRGSSPRPQGDPLYYGGTIPRLMIADVTRDGMYVTPKIDFLTEEGAKKSRPMKKGDVIIAVSGDPGRPCILEVDACIHDGFVGLRNLDQDKIHIPYLYCFLKYFKRVNKKNAVGAIFQNLTTDQIKKIEIPDLPKTEQIRIAKILSEVEFLIAQRKKADSLLDDFLKSIFFRLFGSPTRNEKKWETKACSDLFDMKLGKMLSAKNYKGTHLKPYLRNINVKWGKIDLSDINEMDFSEVEVEKYSLKKNDILVCEGGEVGRTAVLKEDMEGYCFQNALHRLRIKDVTKINSSFFFWTMYIGVNTGMISKETISVTISHFTLEKFKKLKIPTPPIELQNQFSDLVTKTDFIKEEYQQSLDELEKLFGSISQRVFEGELDLSGLDIEKEDENLVNRKKPKLEESSKTAEKKEKQKIEKKPKKELKAKLKSKITWDKVSSQQVAEWIKEKYEGYHFSNEMLIRFLMDEYIVFPDYYSSEELKKYPQLNGADDIKSFIFSAVSNENPFIKLEQHFYNAEKETFQLNVAVEDYELIESREAKERSGIYFSIVEQ